MWANLKKTAGMDVGQVGFHRQKEVGFCTVFCSSRTNIVFNSEGIKCCSKWREIL